MTRGSIEAADLSYDGSFSSTTGQWRDQVMGLGEGEGQSNYKDHVQVWMCTKDTKEAWI